MNQTRYLRAPDRASSPGLNIRHRNHKVTGVALHPPSWPRRTPAQDTPERVNAAPRRPGVPAQNGLPTPPEQHLPHPGIRTLQPDFSRDATPQTPPGHEQVTRLTRASGAAVEQIGTFLISPILDLLSTHLSAGLCTRAAISGRMATSGGDVSLSQPALLRPVRRCHPIHLSVRGGPCSGSRSCRCSA